MAVLARAPGGLATPIDFRFNVPLSLEQLGEIYSRSGLRRPVADRARLAKMRDHANLTVTAWDGPRLVGIARALTDFAFCCYLSDLGVDRDYQRKGVGRAMVEKMARHLGEEVMILLLSAEAAMGYYPKIGFEKVENAWKIARAR
jgi:ribosomal protein S18 acetylase RimI-like enzyme